jgi:hypothetical protein
MGGRSRCFLQAPAALPQGNTPVTNSTGGWVDHTAGPEFECKGKSPTPGRDRLQIPRQSSPKPTHHSDWTTVAPIQSVCRHLPRIGIEGKVNVYVSLVEHRSVRTYRGMEVRLPPPEKNPRFPGPSNEHELVGGRGGLQKQFHRLSVGYKKHWTYSFCPLPKKSLEISKNTSKFQVLIQIPTGRVRGLIS